MFFLREGGVRLGLVVEGEGGRLGLALVMICLRLHIPFSILQEKGVRLGLVVEGEDGRPGLPLDDLSTTTHPLQYRSSELDRQGTGATECV
jgi:hypothetical protein